MAGKAHHRDPRYRRLAAAVRAAAYANPDTRCWRSGMTLDEARAINPKATWDAGHIVDGDLSAGLRAEISTVNRSHGATMGNRSRASGYTW